MIVFLKILLLQVVSLLAPLVVIVPQFRRGWFLTPDDPVSPYGQYEPAMVKIYSRFGKNFGDWWWLGWRNTAYGLSYALKPKFFKELDSYDGLNPTVQYRGMHSIPLPNGDRRFFFEIRRIEIEGYVEWCISLYFFHVIAGYRLRPIYDTWYTNRWRIPGQRLPHRKINMDARPIFSIRSGAADD